MNSIQDDKLNMFLTVIGTCTKNQAIWSTNAIFTASYNAFDAKVILIGQYRDAQLHGTSGLTADKAVKRASMSGKGLFISNRMQSYAHVTKNVELLANVEYTATDLKRAKDTEIAGICTSILNYAKANAAALVAYGVTEVMITELETSITTYSNAISQPQVSKTKTMTATENLAVAFKEADDILEHRLDLDIELFSGSNPDFVSQYRKSRDIVASGNKTSSLLGTVVEAGTEAPVKGVTFTFTVQGNGALMASGNTSIVKKSADKGKFRIANMPEGTYKVVVKKIGYKDQLLTVIIAAGETTTLKVTLERA
ncbi:MAG TPA: carboxypeptidase-like regulatory domain-containing protein [Bacteroidales bacterium]|nr:carboxypeptidase-like regulatory domain-containing protein [Bacteroidales bacterium]